MDNNNGIIHILESQKDGVWKKTVKGADPKTVENLEDNFNITLPAEYKELLIRSNGGELYGDNANVWLFDLQELNSVNTDPDFSDYLKGAFFFGDDEGDYFYYFDVENILGQGAWAVYSVSKGALKFRFSSYSAPNIKSFFARIINGDDILNEPFLDKDPRFASFDIPG